MASTDATNLEIRSAEQIRDSFLRTIRLGFARRGINANVTPGSDWHILGTAIGGQLQTAEANAVIKSEQILPDSSDGDDLARIAANYKLKKSPAAGAIGPIVFDTASLTTTSISAGDRLIDGAGLTYQVVTGGSYSDGDLIVVQAKDTGEQTNHVAGDVLRWVSTPALANEKVLVGPGGLIDGTDADDDESLRAKLYSKLQDPPASGNAEHVAELIEASSAAVQKGVVYPAIQGGATVHGAAFGAPIGTNKSRALSTSLMTGTVTPYVQANLPEHVASTITTVADVETTIAFGLVLPEARTASPPGPGGGWKNGTPWPSVDASTTWKCAVTSVTSSTVFVVDAATAPSVGVSKVAWVNPTTWTVMEATVVALSGTSGAYTITLELPFTGIAVGSLIFPACQNAQAYVDAVLDAFSLMGPGEKSTNVSALVRGYRRPRPAAGWPSSLGGHLTSAISSNAPQSEVSSAQFFYRTDGTTTVSGPAGTVIPQVPSPVTNPPKIFIPKNLAFYRVP